MFLIKGTYIRGLRFFLFQACSDVRVKHCNEVIQGIKVIKLLAWEKYMTNNINKARSAEIKMLMKGAVYRALYS